jgi:putative membrane protein
MQRALAGTAAGLILVAVLSPLASWGEHRSFAAHMGQHLLLGDLAPLLLALAVGVALVHPFAAFPLWAADLAVWHLPAVYEAALHHEAIHVLQHVALFAAGAVLWSSVLSARWSAAHRLAALAGMMVVSVALASLLLWWPRVIYPTYAHAHTLGGSSPLSDQRAGGGMMLLEGSVVALAIAGWLILQLLREPTVMRGAEGASPSP